MLKEPAVVPLLDMYPDMEPRAGPIPVPAIGEYICRETTDRETRTRSTRPGPEPKSPPVKIGFRPDGLRTFQNKGRKRAALVPSCLELIQRVQSQNQKWNCVQWFQSSPSSVVLFISLFLVSSIHYWRQFLISF